MDDNNRSQKKDDFDDLNTSLDDHFKHFDSNSYEEKAKELED